MKTINLSKGLEPKTHFELIWPKRITKPYVLNPSSIFHKQDLISTRVFYDEFNKFLKSYNKSWGLMTGFGPIWPKQLAKQ